MVRTFQINQLFNALTPLQSLALAVSQPARHRRGAVAAARREPRVAADVRAAAGAVPPRRRAGPAGRAAAPTASAGCSRSRPRSPASRACCCSTSRSPACPKASARRSSTPSDALPADVSVLLIEHDMDLVFNFARARDGARQRRACSPRATPKSIATDPRVKAVYLGEGAQARMAELLRVEGLQLRATARRWSCRASSFALDEGQLAGAARPQRHRQDDAAQHAGRRDAPARRAHRARPARTSHAAVARARRRRHRLGAAGAQHLQVADGRREPDARSRAPGRGRWSASTRCSRGWPSARPTWARSSPAASSRCSRSARALVLNPTPAAARRAARRPGADHRRGAAARRSRRVVRDEGHVGDHRRAEPAPDPADHATTPSCSTAAPSPTAPGSAALLADPAPLDPWLAVAALTVLFGT